MTQIATVEKILSDGYAEISVPRKSACGHDCEECAGCGMTGAAIYARAKNLPNAQPGQKVVVESSTGKLLGVVAVVYVLPVVFFLLGYFLSVGLAESIRYVIAIAAAALALIPIVLYDRYAKRHEILTYTILRLF
ncbi:MAG: SoxR reducing system RseC family protein [Clostridiales bacterium]|nr:SoxR reducing system RseC family protein [Oscillospiraceae bacterium]MDD5906232.1 SoxR reducing system RseC family protein [Clostridiales bacterium]